MWIYPYLIFGVIAVFGYSKRSYILNKPGPETVDYGALDIFKGSILLAVIATWPVSLPIWIWADCSSKKEEQDFQKKEEAEAQKRKLNPHYDLSTEDQIEKLREIHDQIKQNR
ncbi:hypothetical protein [Coraliomargarita akajimensis]|uniref:Uncharacterized protein n=1 Tax=Coraliomargarita akajimensis (strain DSM 45221 / IAM 15411 / JCM 23193 / KCTC 12865 / 04OKA010-24) TaxID=583355 RepID=D5ER76_CORAD|nr:hypothetical protein [Coraliomargarita akajimensis]ADE55920.1 hypothetical protein Caka_2907 [Coraliomargarita akajimensis DSM 45221]